LVPLKIVLNVSRFKPALNLNRVLADFGGFKLHLDCMHKENLTHVTRQIVLQLNRHLRDWSMY